MSERHHSDEVPLRQRIRSNPRPALVWATGLALLLAAEFGAVATVLVDLAILAASIVVNVAHVVTSPILPEFGTAVDGLLTSARTAAQALPTLLSREFIPNQGHRTSANGPWVGTFLGLPPAIAWGLRVVAIYAYIFALLYWIWYGYRLFVDRYRHADWTPRDDVVRRLSNHRWGQFGFVVVVLFIGLALFAPTISPTTYEEDVLSPYGNQVEYFDEEAGELREVTVGQANLQSASRGGSNPKFNTGPMEYDDFGRFHPFGTL